LDGELTVEPYGDGEGEGKTETDGEGDGDGDGDDQDECCGVTKGDASMAAVS